MKTIEERAKEYSTCDEDCALCSEVCRKASDERAFIAGALSEHEELTRWRDPKEELPDDDREVLCVTNRRYSTFAVLKHDNYGWWQYVPFQGGGWCGYDGDVLGWRRITKNTIQAMKTNEVAIGDWVCAAAPVINGEERLTPPMQVVAIGETWVHLLIDPDAGDPDEYDIEDIRPIPLTADMLWANEWRSFTEKRFILEIRDNDGRTAASVDAIIENDGVIYIRAWMEGHDLRLRTPYVHQLQHALRLAGIEKEIEL